MKKVQAMNNKQLMIVNSKTLLALMMPFGISLIAVLGFLASKLLSRYRLNAIAALLAKIMLSRTSKKINQSGCLAVPASLTVHEAGR